MSGIEALQRIASEHGRDAYKVVAVSASAFAHQRQQYLAAGFADYIEKPYRVERIYAVLADVLGVVFEYEEDAVEIAERKTIDFNAMALPAAVHGRLVEWTQTHNISQLNREFDELQELGEAERQLVMHLRPLAEDFNMRAIRHILDQINHA